MSNAAQPLTRALESAARDEGFDRVAIAPAGRLDRDGQALEAWLQRGHQASMDWMNRDPQTRSDPRRVLPGCRSVVVLALNYWPGEEPARFPGRSGRVALYARGRDYHRVIGRKLKRLASWLEGRSGAVSRTFVDTGPVLERAWAERAGMGWIGKNANLLTRDLGSWLLLGEILTTAELEYGDGPHADFCGTCSACIDACPTDAIVEPGQVDSNSCISYWTIEHRGPVPGERRAGMQDWIFGCDICQDVCPWNRSFAATAERDLLERRDDLRDLEPSAILRMNEAEFRARYSGTALMRAKWEGMRRNACIVLGNRGDAHSIPVLAAAALEDPDEVVRSHAAWALGCIGEDEALRALESARDRERRGPVREEIEQALRRST